MPLKRRKLPWMNEPETAQGPPSPYEQGAGTAARPSIDQFFTPNYSERFFDIPPQIKPFMWNYPSNFIPFLLDQNLPQVSKDNIWRIYRVRHNFNPPGFPAVDNIKVAWERWQQRGPF